MSTTTAKVQADRLAALDQLCGLYPFVSVLKGSGTIIQQQGNPAVINTLGNPGMASAGTGDVLAGMIGAYMGQQLQAFEAAKAGVYIHACCAEGFAGKKDESGLIASDIIHLIPEVVRQIRARA